MMRPAVSEAQELLASLTVKQLRQRLDQLPADTPVVIKLSGGRYLNELVDEVRVVHAWISDGPTMVLRVIGCS